MGIIQLFCEVDDFCKWFMVEWEKRQIGEGTKRRLRSRGLSCS
ncbi:MAG: IS982 family transposase, partial [Desulfamplus sp.]|nr:IS982 family transposase [Desulfamplus sp.]